MDAPARSVGDRQQGPIGVVGEAKRSSGREVRSPFERESGEGLVRLRSRWTGGRYSSRTGGSRPGNPAFQASRRRRRSRRRSAEPPARRLAGPGARGPRCPRRRPGARPGGRNGVRRGWRTRARGFGRGASRTIDLRQIHPGDGVRSLERDASPRPIVRDREPGRIVARPVEVEPADDPGRLRGSMRCRKP